MKARPDPQMAQICCRRPPAYCILAQKSCTQLVQLQSNISVQFYKGWGSGDRHYSWNRLRKESIKDCRIFRLRLQNHFRFVQYLATTILGTSYTRLVKVGEEQAGDEKVGYDDYHACCKSNHTNYGKNTSKSNFLTLVFIRSRVTLLNRLLSQLLL